MKKLYLLIPALLLNAANIFAMNENRENYQDPKPIVIKSVEQQHAAFAKQITKNLKAAQKALKTDTLEMASNVNLNLAAVYKSFKRWLNFFDASNKEESKEFIRPMRKLFVEFKDTLDQERICGTADYPVPQHHAFRLNLRIQKLTDQYSN
jgi:hypothetical protein